MTVYLLHFDRRISENHTAQHYLGSTKSLYDRIEQHRKGVGARLPQVAKERGIGFTVCRVWLGGGALERQLKGQKNSPRLCPICKLQRNNNE